MLRGEEGGVSLMCLALVAPLLFFFLSVGIELQQFFGVREDVQRILDGEARLISVRELSSSEIDGRLRRELFKLKPYVQVSKVNEVRTAASTELHVTGVYRGVFSQAFSALSGSVDMFVPFSVYAKARKPRASVLIAFDRAVKDQSEMCGDSRLKVRAELADRLVEDFRMSGVDDVRVGIFPAVTSPFELLKSEQADAEVRCGEGRNDAHYDLPSIRGVAADPGVGVDVAYGAVEAFLSGLPPDVEVPALIFVSQNNERALENVIVAAALVAQEFERVALKVKVIGLMQNGDGPIVVDVWRGGSGGVETRIVPFDFEGSDLSQISDVVVRHVHHRSVLAQ
jgi:hypothetical protein